MKRYKSLGETPISSPLPAEDIFELHAARLVLLLRYCGIKNRIDGLTKFAKLDFFVRYPDFFSRAAEEIGASSRPTGATSDSSMVRYRYGPWDERYYHLLSYLESTGLITCERVGKSYRVKLTSDGEDVANIISHESCYESLVQHIKDVKRVMGSKGGTTLKKLIYELFTSEVVEKSFGEEIK